MTILILGPNGSGKSTYAEKLAARWSAGALYYIATMIPYGEEGRIRVEKHRIQRASAGFVTVEQPFHVSAIPLPLNAAVLLEDVSNLLSNNMFDGKGGGNENSVFEDITAMCGICRTAVLVSIDGLTSQPEYDDETRGYISALNKLNGRLWGFADTVITMRDGTPFLMKGDLYAPD